MTDYVLIHGAWHGSWCWARVRRLLAAGAHRVFTPTLTGVGERSHLLSRDVGLDTHIADVANLMIWENLRDVVLVGHSYGRPSSEFPLHRAAVHLQNAIQAFSTDGAFSRRPEPIAPRGARTSIRCSTAPGPRGWAARPGPWL